MSRNRCLNSIQVLVVCVISFACSAQDSGAAAACDSIEKMAGNAGNTTTATVPAETDTLVITARLTEILGKFVDNDAYDYVYIMKYRVMEVEEGRYDRKEILVGHYNPLIARTLVKDRMDPYVDGTVERFSVGAKHRLKLVYPIEVVWDGPIEDEYYDTDLLKYYALSADVLK